MIRLHFVVEGQTEEEFVNSVLALHLAGFSVFADARCVTTSWKGPVRASRGGLTSYEMLRKDLRCWMAEDRRPDSLFTTMVDLYRLPHDFPGYQAAVIKNPLARVELLEQSLAEAIGDRRLIPYIQLHEFESLLFVHPEKLEMEFPNRAAEISALCRVAAQFTTPEEINEGDQTAPSRRIIEKLPGYKGRKPSAGPRVAAAIGLPALRSACPHFHDWLSRLEQTSSAGMKSLL